MIHTGNAGTLVLLTVLLTLALRGAVPGAERKPNILVIMTDDVGWPPENRP